MTNSKTNVSFFAGYHNPYCNTPHKNTDGISTFNRPTLSATYAGSTRPTTDNPFKIASTYIEIEGLNPRTVHTPKCKTEEETTQTFLGHLQHILAQTSSLLILQNSASILASHREISI